MTETQELISKAIKLTNNAGAQVKNPVLSMQILSIGLQLKSVLDTLEEYENNSLYGLYNDHQLDYGIDPKDCYGRGEGDNSWILQTK